MKYSANPRTMITRLSAPLRAFSACTQAGCMLVRIEPKALPQISTKSPQLSPQLSRVAFGQQAQGCLLKLKGQIWRVVALHTLQLDLANLLWYNRPFVSCNNRSYRRIPKVCTKHDSRHLFRPFHTEPKHTQAHLFGKDVFNKPVILGSAVLLLLLVLLPTNYIVVAEQSSVLPCAIKALSAKFGNNRRDSKGCPVAGDFALLPAWVCWRNQSCMETNARQLWKWAQWSW